MVSVLPLTGEIWIDIVGKETRHAPHCGTAVHQCALHQSRILRNPARRSAPRAAISKSRTAIAKVAIVSASLAQRLWGRRIRSAAKSTTTDKLVEVVGITPDFRSTSLDKEPVNMLYVPYWQRPRLGASLLLRTAMDPRVDRQCAARRRLGNR